MTKVPSMYEMEGTSPGLTAPAGQLPGYPAPQAARRGQTSARGSGFPNPPASRGRPR